MNILYKASQKRKILSGNTWYGTKTKRKALDSKNCFDWII